MPYKTPLRLTTGADQCLSRIAPGVAVLALIAIATGPSSITLKIIASGFSILVFLGLAWCSSQDSRLELVLYPNGRAQWRSPGQAWKFGSINTNYWRSGHYAVISARSAGRPVRFLVSRSNQNADDFRILLSWLLLGLPEQTKA